jgi:ABC-type transporter Mla subunit MlaD
MKILTTSTDAQELKIIPRSYVSTITVKLRSESTNVVTTDTGISATTDKGYLVFSNNYALTENVFYELTILDGLNVIYRDKVFCTDQTLSDYTVNENEYTTENSYDNDYIII